MGTVFKVLVALVIGAGMLHYGQQMFISSMKSQVTASQAPAWFTTHPEVPTAHFDRDALNRQLTQGVGPIDTTAGVRAGTLNTARQADIMRRNAESAVPLPRH